MEEILILIVGLVAGWMLREWLAMYRMTQIMNQFEVHVQEQVEEEMENMIPIFIEQHDDKFYVYQQEGGFFMAQGKTRRELEDNLMKRYPGKKFAANTSNLHEVGFK
jgi:hypothetical protein